MDEMVRTLRLTEYFLFLKSLSHFSFDRFSVIHHHFILNSDIAQRKFVNFVFL